MFGTSRRVARRTARRTSRRQMAMYQDQGGGRGVLRRAGPGCAGCPGCPGGSGPDGAAREARAAARAGHPHRRGVRRAEGQDPRLDATNAAVRRAPRERPPSGRSVPWSGGDVTPRTNRADRCRRGPGRARGGAARPRCGAGARPAGLDAHPRGDGEALAAARRPAAHAPACGRLPAAARGVLRGDGLAPARDQARRERLAVRPVLHLDPAARVRQDKGAPGPGLADPRARRELPRDGGGALHDLAALGRGELVDVVRRRRRGAAPDGGGRFRRH